jgi:hypothetical protein
MLQDARKKKLMEVDSLCGTLSLGLTIIDRNN